MLFMPSLAFSQCDVRPPIQPNEVVIGTLASGDCTVDELFGTGDPSFIDLYSLTLPGPGELTVALDSSDFDAVVVLMDPTLTNVIAEDDDSGGNSNALLSVSLPAGSYTLLANSFSPVDPGTYTLTTSCSGCTADLAASVLPSSRSVQVDDSATVFATVINTLTTVASSCGIAPLSNVAADFSYQTTDSATNTPIGAANTPVDIPPGEVQSYLIAFTPTAAFDSTDVQLSFECANTNPAPVTVGLNTLLLSASDTPVSDVVALSATPTGDGIVALPGSLGANAFAVATVNVGSSDTITASADTGTATVPVSLSVCESNPATGECLSAPAASVTSSIDAGATPTFSVFVTGSGTVPFDPATNRIFVRFRDAGDVTRGSTSVAVRTE
jgi:hypothetical protein